MWKSIVRVDLFVVASNWKLWDIFLYENKLIYISANNTNNKKIDLCNSIGYSEEYYPEWKADIGSYNTSWLYLYHILEEEKLIHAWKSKGTIIDFQALGVYIDSRKRKHSQVLAYCIWKSWFSQVYFYSMSYFYNQALFIWLYLNLCKIP